MLLSKKIKILASDIDTISIRRAINPVTSYKAFLKRVPSSQTGGSTIPSTTATKETSCNHFASARETIPARGKLALTTGLWESQRSDLAEALQVLSLNRQHSAYARSSGLGIWHEALGDGTRDWAAVDQKVFNGWLQPMLPVLMEKWLWPVSFSYTQKPRVGVLGAWSDLLCLTYSLALSALFSWRQICQTALVLCNFAKDLLRFLSSTLRTPSHIHAFLRLYNNFSRADRISPAVFYIELLKISIDISNYEPEKDQNKRYVDR